MSKGISEIATAALYVGISISAISVALTVGTPAIENMRDAAAVRSAQDFMQRFDAAVDEVVSEGRGSTRKLEISIDRGRLFYSNDSNALVYRLQTDADVISPQSSRQVGNIILSSNANVEVYNVTSSDLAGYDGPKCAMMENEHIKACIKHVGGPDNQQPINTSNLLTYYEFKDESSTLDGNLSVEIDQVANSSWGDGYTQVERYGEFIGTGRVRASIESDYRYNYDVVFQLPSGADFIKTDIQNVR